MQQAPARIAVHESIWQSSHVQDMPLWIETMDSAEKEDLARTVASLRGRALDALTPEDMPRSGPLADATRRWRRGLKDGVGFVLVRGLDVDALSLPDLELAFVALGLHLGSLVSQNLKGELLTHVRDTGADPNLSSTRLYTTRAEQDFHTDAADIIGLFCRRTARAGGISRICSSGAIVSEIQRTRPDLYPTLFGNFPWHYQEDGQAPLWFERPICTAPAVLADGARISTFFIPWYIRRSQELSDAPRLTRGQSEVISLVERLANEPRFYLDMTFERGDVQWLKNAAILHKRTAYEDFEEPDRKRDLLRLWLRAPDFVDGDEQLRRGISLDRVR